MFTITVTGNSFGELFSNLKTLLDTYPVAHVAAQPAAAPAPATPAPVASAPPAAPPAQHTAPASAPQAPAPGPKVPTAAPSYTVDQLARAGAELAQSGKMQQALALLAKYGVQTINQLKPELYGEFAAGLCALGAEV